MGAMDSLQKSVNSAFGFGKAEKIDPNVCKAPSGETYTVSDIKNMSTRQLNGLKFSSGFVGDAQSENCIKLVNKLRDQGYISVK